MSRLSNFPLGVFVAKLIRLRYSDRSDSLIPTQEPGRSHTVTALFQ